MKKSVSTFAVILFTVFSISVMAQANQGSDQHNVTVKIPSVAMVGLKGGNINFDLAATAPGEAGGAIGAGATNSDTWMNYSSVVAGQNTRKVTASINSNLPAGISLMVAAAADNGNGNGTMGVSAGKKELSTTATDIVTGIGSAYTGTGNNKGHQLTYSLKLNEANYASLRVADHNLTVTYTITD